MRQAPDPPRLVCAFSKIGTSYGVVAGPATAALGYVRLGTVGVILDQTAVGARPVPARRRGCLAAERELRDHAAGMSDAAPAAPGPEPFSAEWAAALRRELESNADFRRAAAGWQGRLVLQRNADPAAGAIAAAVCLDLADGSCSEARPARTGDRREAVFVIAGSRAAWRRVLAGGASPILALLRGRLKLVKGTIAGLTPLAAAAEQLVAAARRLESAVPSTAAPAAAAEWVGRAPLVFRSTSPAGIDFASLPMQLWEKSKRLGVWDPSRIDFSRDRQDWRRLAPAERDLLLRLAALFGAGEESVTRELLPLIRVIASEGRLEEEIYLTAFLWEEAKHVEAFRRFFVEVADERGDLGRYHTPAWRRIFYSELPAAMARLEHDASPLAQARASATYNMIVEGVLAETGYHVYHSILEERGILPGMQRVVRHLEADEARHLAYGVHLLSRLVAEHGEPVWQAIEKRMDELLQPAIAIVQEAFDLYEPGKMPFGLEAEVFVGYALRQFEKRMRRIERARAPGHGDPAAGEAGRR